MTSPPNPAPRKNPLPKARPLGSPAQPVQPRSSAAVPQPAAPRPAPAAVPEMQSAPSQFNIQVQTQPAAASTKAPSKPSPSRSVLVIAASLAGVVLLAGVGLWFGMQPATKPIADGKKPQKEKTEKTTPKEAGAQQNSTTDSSPPEKPTPATPVVKPPVPVPAVAAEPEPKPDFSPRPAIASNFPIPKPAAVPTVPRVPTEPLSVEPDPVVIKTTPNKPADPLPKPSVFPTPSIAAPNQPAEFAVPAGDEELIAAIEKLYRDKKLLTKKEYPTVRKLFADRFERLHGQKLAAGYGADAEAMQTWFAENSEVRDDFYTALDPQADDLAQAGSIFNELRKAYPDKLAPYSALAIAVATVWDKPRGGIYEYDHHANRCKATMPQNLFTAIQNFDYYVKAEALMEGRIRYVPWEFLVHVVNHRTPEGERGWAMQNFVSKRVMFGKCYSDVPYDNEMLRTHSAFANLNGKDYTLPNILQFGGVCAMQADYASRVGKSIGVASEYVRGEAAGGELHAWVMWIELKQATPTGLRFTLESHGRYFGDKYYVGTLRNPQTGAEMTDRDLELRLQTVGLDTVAKRHTQLVMQAYPQLVKQAELSTTDQLSLLGQIITYNPGCEDAWLTVARLARESNGEKQYAKQFNAVLDRLFVTFTGVPDFTWKVFGDIAAYAPEGKPRNALYERLIQLYEQGERPDLACEARLAWADMMQTQGKELDAVQGLATSIKKFPSEGRYVPKMLDKLEALCANVEKAQGPLVAFYTEVLPLVPQMRGSSPSPFAIKMFERGIGVFTRLNQPQLAQAAQQELANIQSGNGRREQK